MCCFDKIDTKDNSQGSDLSESDLQKLEENARPSSTVKSTEYGMKKFSDWLSRRDKCIDFHTVSAEDLNEILRKFYAEVKLSSKGGSMSPSTLTCIRAAIHRHITAAPFYRCLNIIKDREFSPANNMFIARCKLFFKSGNKKPEHKKSIDKADMKKIGEYFNKWNTSPDILLEACWFFLCFYFGRRGREGWVAMTKKTFTVVCDSSGNDYVHTDITETTKNHQGGHKQGDLDYSDVRMYGPGVEIFKFYLSKLNEECGRLFQTPMKNFYLNGRWYKNIPMGKNTLSTIMQQI